MDRNIIVDGQGQMLVAPDLVEIRMTTTTFNRDYNTAINEATRNQNTLLQALNRNGFTKDMIETNAFRVEPIYQTNTNTLEGYQVIDQMTLRNKFQVDLVNLAISSINESGVPVEFQVLFTLADPSRYQQELLTKAFDDALNKAIILTNASMTTLGSIKKIESLNNFLQPYSRMQADFSNLLNTPINFNPEKILLENRVVITWNLI